MYLEGFIGKNTIKPKILEAMVEVEGILRMTEEEFKLWVAKHRCM